MGDILADGAVYGRWTVIGDAPKRRGKPRLVRCRCECGTEREIQPWALINGGSKSCGCAKREKIKDLTGQQFTMLTVIERVENNKRNEVCWRCQCACGNTTIVTTGNLRSSTTKSCGCLVGQRGVHGPRIAMTVHVDEPLYHRLAKLPGTMSAKVREAIKRLIESEGA